MIAGAAVGYLFPDGSDGNGFHATALEPLAKVFLRMIGCLIAPLLFGTLVVGIAGHGEDLKRIGRLAFRSTVYFEIVTTLALIIGLVTVNLVKPGLGVDLAGATTDAGVELAAMRPSFARVLEQMVPQSVFDAAARNEALQITFFAIIFAVALARVPGPPGRLMLSACQSLSEVMLKFVAIVMKFAPIGVGAAIATTVGRSGLGVLGHLGVFVLTLYGALALFVVVVLLPVALLFRVPLRRFWQAARAPLLIAFTTSSSGAALPLALQNMERLGVPRRIVSFILPTGYAFNMAGTSVFLGMAAVFVAQAAGVAMPVSQQVVMILTLMLTSKGVAAVPRTSLVVLSATLTQFGLPLQGVAVILGVDAFMDMARTTLNLLGNCLATVVLARWDGSFETSPEHTPEYRPAAHPSLAAPVGGPAAPSPRDPGAGLLEELG